MGCDTGHGFSIQVIMHTKPDHQPPKLPLKALRWFCDPALLEDVEGDLRELFIARAARNIRVARLLYARDVIQLFRPGIVKIFREHHSTNPTDMFINHVRTAIRQAARYKGYTAINVAGLVVGLASCLLILLWVNDERQKDQFHDKGDRLYQVWRNLVQSNGDVHTTSGIPFPLEHVLRTQYPEVETVTSYTWEMEYMLRVGDMASYEKGRFATPGFFDVFGFQLIAGDPRRVLVDAPTIVISDRLAEKLFGERWREVALGRSVKVNESSEYEVTGVFESPGDRSSLQFDWLIAAQGFLDNQTWTNSWFNGGFSMFFTLKPGADIESLKKRIEQEVIRNTNRESNEPLVVQRFAEHYLHGTFEDGVPAGGRIQYVRILSGIALFLFLLAAINFMNLATARASLRAREVGVRKVMGAQRRTLSLQFLTESSLYAIVATFLASLIVYLLLPYFNTMMGKAIQISFGDPQVWYVVGAITVVTGLLSGAYPAMVLSSITMARALKGRTRQAGGSSLRHVLVTFQFAISIFLIGGTFVISQQLSYILHKDIGLQRDNLVSVDLTGELYTKKETYLNLLRSIPEVKGVTFTSGSPIDMSMSTGGAQWPGKDPDMMIEINVLSVGEDFAKTMGIRVVKGEDFSNVFLRDSARFLVNEVLAGIISNGDPVGTELSVWGTRGTIAGVVSDFHMSSMYDPIAPLIIRCDPRETGTAYIRLTGNVDEAVTAIERLSRDLNPAFPFRYTFVDEDFEQQYRGEQSVSAIVNIFAGVSVFIACLGLLGLSSFSADQRTKEIAVRKVHGATTASLVLLLSRQYTRLMIIAFVVAAPVSYFYMQQWLSDFAYRIDLNVLLFVGAGVVTFVIGTLTVGYKSYTASLANPARTLKEE